MNDMTCVPIRKNGGADFRNYDFKIFGESFYILNLAYNSKTI